MVHDNKTVDPEGFLLVSQYWDGLNFTGKVKYPRGDKIWYKDGQVHREDGPAVVDVDGHKYWYKNGKQHREDGPAVEYADGSKSWFKNNLQHREDGPAVVWPSGHIFWYYNGVEGLEHFPPELKKKLTRKFLHGT